MKVLLYLQITLYECLTGWKGCALFTSRNFTSYGSINYFCNNFVNYY